MIPSPSSTFDPAAFREQVRHEWDAVAADWGHAELWRVVERAAQGLNDRLVELAGVAPGQHVLDLGTGVGEPAVTAARRVGPGGRVLGIDLADRMLEAGRRRVHSLGLTNVELRLGDAQDPGLPESSFDGVVSRWALMLVPGLPGALRQLWHLLVPGGRFAVALWGHPERVPLISLAASAARELVLAPAPPPGAPGPLWPHGLERLVEMAEAAGFTEVRSEVADSVFEFPSAPVYADFVCRMAGPIKVLVDGLEEDLRQRFQALLAERAAPRADSDGRLRLVNENLLVTGRRPENKG
jgi:SAM-dependent methyltransferase